MAWLKDIECARTGMIVPYWEVISIVYNHRDQISDLTVGGWASEQAYEDGKDSVMQRSWSIPSGLAPQLAAGALTFVTSYAKSQSEFEGSEDA